MTRLEQNAPAILQHRDLKALITALYFDEPLKRGVHDRLYQLLAGLKPGDTITVSAKPKDTTDHHTDDTGKRLGSGKDRLD